MELPPKKLYRGDALLRRTRQPVPERGPGTPLFIEARQARHALYRELHRETVRSFEYIARRRRQTHAACPVPGAVCLSRNG
jgi:hypothetical protein